MDVCPIAREEPDGPLNDPRIPTNGIELGIWNFSSDEDDRFNYLPSHPNLQGGPTAWAMRRTWLSFNPRSLATSALFI